MSDNTPEKMTLVIWVFGAFSTGAIAVAGYLWTEIVSLDRRISALDQTSQVQLAAIAECANLGMSYIGSSALGNGDASQKAAAEKMFAARGCEKVKVEGN